MTGLADTIVGGVPGDCIVADADTASLPLEVETLRQEVRRLSTRVADLEARMQAAERRPTDTLPAQCVPSTERLVPRFPTRAVLDVAAPEPVAGALVGFGWRLVATDWEGDEPVRITLVAVPPSVLREQGPG